MSAPAQSIDQPERPIAPSDPVVIDHRTDAPDTPAAPVSTPDPTISLLRSVLGPVAEAVAGAKAEEIVQAVMAPHTAVLTDLQGQVQAGLAQLAAQPDVQAIANEAAAQATAAIRADFEAFKADTLAHRTDIYSQLRQTASNLLADKRSFYVWVGAIVMLTTVVLILGWSYIFQGNQRAGDVLKPVGVALAILLPPSANAAARALSNVGASKPAPAK